MTLIGAGQDHVRISYKSFVGGWFPEHFQSCRNRFDTRVPQPCRNYQCLWPAASNIGILT